MPYLLFWWNEEIEEHLAEHGVSPEEFEADVDGRFLACVYELIDEATVSPVTAYEIE
jgi:hypothetical protein